MSDLTSLSHGATVQVTYIQPQGDRWTMLHEHRLFTSLQSTVPVIQSIFEREPFTIQRVE